MSTKKVNPVDLLVRLASVFAVSAVPNIAVGAALDVAVWKSAVMAGAVSVLSALYAIAAAYKKDGDLTEAELQEILDILAAEEEEPVKKAPAKKKTPVKKAPAKKAPAKKVTK
jgi:predicted anti-sigma-YlaC factor YlaD